MKLPEVSFETLTDENVDDIPPIITVYGPEGIGKSSLAAEFPNPVFLRIQNEKAPSGMRPKAWKIASYAEFMAYLDLLYTGEHTFQTVVVDSLTSLERGVIWKKVIEAHKRDNGQAAANIESYGYGAGYKLAMPYWGEVFAKLDSLRNDRGMSIVLIGHSLIKEFKDPENPSYRVYDIALQDGEKVSAARFVKEQSDAVLFIKREASVEEEDPNNKFNNRVIAKGTASRWIHTEGQAAFAAKNRFSMKPKLSCPKGGGFAGIAKYIPGFAQLTASGPVAAETPEEIAA